MKKILLIVAVAALGWLLFWPVPIDPVAWEPPRAPDLEGAYGTNNRLEAVTLLAEGVGVGPEDVVVDEQGHIYTGYEDGRVVRLDADGGNPDLIANTGGRPLGLAFNRDGHLLVADGYRGLLRLAPSGKIEVLATEANGVPFGFTNNVAVAADGTIYFSDASSQFGPALKARDDVIEHRGHGRLLRHDPDTGETEVLLDGLQFANGVAVMPDQQSVLVAETGGYDIIRYWIAGERAGEREPFFSNLPGLPDNLSSDGEDTIWVALYAPRNALLDAMGPWPFLRKIAFRLPQSLQPRPAAHAFVLGLSTDAQVTHNLQHRGPGSYHPITGVYQAHGKLYLGSLEYPALAVYDLPDAPAGADNTSDGR